MLKKDITYTDFNGNERTETFYFNLTQAELVELEVSHEGGLKESLEKIVAAEDGAKIIAEMKSIVLKAYGVKSADGKHFIKNDQLRQEFEGSEAYSVLFMEMVTQAESATEFVNGVVPKELRDQNQTSLPVDRPNLTPVPEEPRVLTPVEAREMDHDELASGIATGKYKLGKD